MKKMPKHIERFRVCGPGCVFRISMPEIGIREVEVIATHHSSRQLIFEVRLRHSDDKRPRFIEMEGGRQWTYAIPVKRKIVESTLPVPIDKIECISHRHTAHCRI